MNDVLGDLPEGLNEIYNRSLRNIPKHLKQRAIKLLQFALFSEKPLSEKETIDALAVDIGCPFNKRNRLKSLMAIYHALTSLVELRSDERTKETYVQLAHASVRDFLLSETPEIPGAPSQCFSRTEKGTVIVLVCLSYLGSVCNIPQPPPEKKSLEYPLLQYAAERWYDLAREEEIGDATSDAVARFLDPLNPVRSRWISYVAPQEQAHAEHGSKLYWACNLGLISAVRILLMNGADVNHYGGLYGYALSVACGSLPTDFSTHLARHGKASQASCMHRKIGIVRMLLLYRADPNNQGGLSGTALRNAMAWGNTLAFHDLLRAGANPNSSNARLGSPLQIALDSNNEEFVCGLVIKGADINGLNPAMQQRVIFISERNGVDERTRMRLRMSAGNSIVPVSTYMSHNTMPVPVSKPPEDSLMRTSFGRVSNSLDHPRHPPSREQIERWRSQGFQ